MASVQVPPGEALESSNAEGTPTADAPLPPAPWPVEAVLADVAARPDELK